MSLIVVGDWVKPRKPLPWKEYGVGQVVSDRVLNPEGHVFVNLVRVRWEDGSQNEWHVGDLVHADAPPGLKVGDFVKVKANAFMAFRGLVGEIVSIITPGVAVAVKWGDGEASFFYLEHLVKVHALPRIKPPTFSHGDSVRFRHERFGDTSIVGKVMGRCDLNKVVVRWPHPHGESLCSASILVLVEPPQLPKFKVGDVVMTKKGGYTGVIINLLEVRQAGLMPEPTQYLVKWDYSGKEGWRDASTIVLSDRIPLPNHLPINSIVRNIGGTWYGRVKASRLVGDVLQYLILFPSTGKKEWHPADSLRTTVAWMPGDFFIVGDKVMPARYRGVAAPGTITKVLYSPDNIICATCVDPVVMVKWSDCRDEHKASPSMLTLVSQDDVFCVGDRVVLRPEDNIKVGKYILPADWLIAGFHDAQSVAGTIVKINNPDSYGMIACSECHASISVKWDHLDITVNCFPTLLRHKRNLCKGDQDMNPKGPYTNGKPAPDSPWIVFCEKAFTLHLFATEAEAREFAEKKTVETSYEHTLYERKAKCSPQRNVAWE